MEVKLEIQYNSINVSNAMLVKEALADARTKGIKKDDIDELNIYYIPSRVELNYAVRLKDGKVKGNTLIVG